MSVGAYLQSGAFGQHRAGSNRWVHRCCGVCGGSLFCGVHLDITVNEFHLGRFSRQQAHGNPNHRARLQLARVLDFVARLQLVPQAGRAKVALGQAFQRIARLHHMGRFVFLVCGPGVRGRGMSSRLRQQPAVLRTRAFGE